MAAGPGRVAVAPPRRAHRTRQRPPLTLQQRRARALLGGSALFALIVLATSFPIGTLLSQHSALASSSGEVARLSAVDRSLTRQLAQLSDPATVAGIARIDFGLVPKGARAYVVLPPALTAADAKSQPSALSGAPVVPDSARVGGPHRAQSVGPAARRHAPRRARQVQPQDAPRRLLDACRPDAGVLALTAVPGPADEADREVVSRLLGRPPSAPFAVRVRTTAGVPAVIENAPLLDDGRPMPTRYWLVDAALREAVSRLEASGGVRRAQAEVDAGALAAAHARYAAQRDRTLPAGHSGPRPSGGVGGTRRGVKCLHAHLAWHLAGGDDPVGRWTAEQLGVDRGAYVVVPPA